MTALAHPFAVGILIAAAATVVGLALLIAGACRALIKAGGRDKAGPPW